MSDLNTNPAARYGGATRTAAEIDQGLRSYMLGVYNYMTIGLAITGLFALGIYMLSITSDASAAAKTASGAAAAARALPSPAVSSSLRSATRSLRLR